MTRDEAMKSAEQALAGVGQMADVRVATKFEAEMLLQSAQAMSTLAIAWMMFADRIEQ